jgi:hypothetical protein
MFSIYFLQPYGTTTVSPSNFTESNVARANERALKIVKKSTSAQHNVVSEARTDKANYDTTPISPRAPCDRTRRFRDFCVTILKDLRQRLAVAVLRALGSTSGRTEAHTSQGNQK